MPVFHRKPILVPIDFSESSSGAIATALEIAESRDKRVLIGEPGTEIIQHASEVGADLVVMPSQGLHGLKRLVLGSTTERVLRHSETPVLVLRDGVNKTVE